MMTKNADVIDRTCTVSQLIYATTKIQCLVLDLAGNRVFEIPENHLKSCFCMHLARLTGTLPNIDHLYKRCKDACNMDTHIIYTCPYNLSNIIIPVSNGNDLVAALQVGPIMTDDPIEINNTFVSPRPDITSDEKHALMILLTTMQRHDTSFLNALAQIISMLLNKETIAPSIREIPIGEFEKESLIGEACSNVVEAALGFIAENYMNKISLNDVAQNVYVHPTHLSRLLNQHTSCSFREYINRMRITRARQLLLNPELNIATICSEVGFSDQSYFDKVFKTLEGVTPSQFRRNNLPEKHQSTMITYYPESPDKYRYLRLWPDETVHQMSQKTVSET